MNDILIKNATIIDGTGAPRFRGDLGISGGKIIMNGLSDKAESVIDAGGRIVSPGFIDAHSHGDLVLGMEISSLCKTTQGVTTEITGQCGLSIAPVNPRYLDLAKQVLSVATNVFPEDMANWESFLRYLEYADKQPLTVNSKMLIGHSTIRIAVMGLANRAATQEELEKMKFLLKEAMDAGAAGFSTGLIYTPCCYADRNEIIELAKVIRPYNGIYASHMRNESCDVVKSVEETIEVGRQAGVRVCISHHKALGRSNWGLQKQTLERIHDAREKGINVICDQYPYTCCMTHMSACIPPWHLDQGYPAMTQKLKDPAFRKTLQKEMADPSTPYDNYYLNAGGWNGVLVATAAKTPEAEGLFLAEYAEKTGKEPFDAFFDLMISNRCESTAVYSSMCEQDVCEIAADEFCVVGSDGLTRSWTEKGHPRACGTFPHAICYFVKEKGIISLEGMIHKMTGLTAGFAGLSDRGTIKEGNAADLIIFDYDRLKDTATYKNPNSITEGIDYVIVNGEIVYQDKKLTGVHSGKILRHNT